MAALKWLGGRCSACADSALMLILPVVGHGRKLRCLTGVSKRVIFLNSVFPCLSETFVFDQFSQLLDADMPLELISNHRPAASAVHPRMRSLVERVEYLSEASKLEVFAAHGAALLRHPLSYLGCCFSMLKGQEKLTTSLAQFTGAALVMRRHCRAGEPLPRVHAHFTYGAAAVALWLSRLAGVPYSLTLHGSDLNFDQPADLKAKLLEAEALVSISDFNRQYLRQQYPESSWDNVAVIPLGALPQTCSEPADAATGAPLRILSVGRLSEHKAQHLLIESCLRLREQGLAFECHIVGEGPLQAALEAQIQEAGLESCVKLLGPRYHHEVLALYGSADLFVLSSVAEGMPMVLMEAMQAKVPVVAPSLSGIPELLAQGRAGLLVEPGSVDELSAALASCVRGEVDLLAMAELGQRHVAEHFDLQRNALRFKDFLESED